VYGGVFDDQFAAASRAFFDLVREGRFHLVLSALLRTEINQAPAPVRGFFADCQVLGELVEVSEEAIQLRQAYLDAGIVAPRWSADALHVAVATVTACRVIVSWNFKHIVNFRKIPLYNAVNETHGYRVIAIHSPLEVIADES